MAVFDFLKKKKKAASELPPPPVPSPESKHETELPPLPEGGPELPPLPKGEESKLPELPELPPFPEESGKEIIPRAPEIQTEFPKISAKGEKGIHMPPPPPPSAVPKETPERPAPEFGKMEMPPPPPAQKKAPKMEIPPMPPPPPAPGMHEEIEKPGEMPEEKHEEKHEEKPEKPEREVIVKHEMPTKPLFVSMDDFQYIINGSNSIKEKLDETEEIILKLNELKNIEEKEFEKWRLHLEDIERKINYVDEIVSKAE